MAFNTYSDTIPDMFLEIVAQLVAADNTKFASVETNANQAAFQYIPEGKYFHFKTEVFTYYYGSNSWYNGNASIVLTTGTGWDGTNKVPNGTTTSLRMPLYSLYTGTSGQGGYQGMDSAGTTWLNTRTYEHKLYIDSQGIFWNIYNPFTECQSSGVYFITEFIPVTAREFDDANSNIFIACLLNNIATGNYAYSGQSYETNCKQYARLPIYAGTTSIFQGTLMRYAYKSQGNNKIYYNFPYYFNDPTGTPVAYLTPIAQSKRVFFLEKANSGLATNDVISWLDPDNVTIHKFIVVDIASGDGASNYYIAMPYDNPFVYV